LIGGEGGSLDAAVEGQPDHDHPMTAVEEVAQGFLEAYGAFDTDRAITYHADIIGLID
jgi:hypothetical protein